MVERLRSRAAAAAATLAAAGLGDAVPADVINVPGDFATIQTAVTAAADGDEIVVAPGTYFGLVNFQAKAITIRSSNPDDPAVVAATVIDGAGQQGVFMPAGPGGTVSGFTIVNSHDVIGGGADIRADGATVTRCVFSGNSATIGGGLHFEQAAGVTVSHCRFEGNTAAGAGGAIHAGSGASAVVEDCVFDGNGADYGGAIYFQQIVAAVSRCRFDGNTAGLLGGALFCSAWGGGGDVTAVNCLLTGNEAGQSGGAAFNYGFTHASSLVLTNCTLAGNVALTGAAGGLDGATDSGSIEIDVRNCVLLGNPPVEIAAIDGVAVSYTNVQGGFPGTGNIDADPVFVDPDHGDWRLSFASPCIDAGSNFDVPPGVTTDLDGEPRFLDVPETIDTGLGEPPVVDMGAYESSGVGCLAVTGKQVACQPDGTTFTITIEGLSACTGDTVTAAFTGSGGAPGQELCFSIIVNDNQGGFCCSTQACARVPDCAEATGDLDGDGTVGVLDLLIMLGQFGPCAGACPADLDHDGEVGVTDLLLLLANWD